MWLALQSLGKLETISYVNFALEPESASLAITVKTVSFTVVFSGIRARIKTSLKAGALSLMSTKATLSVTFVLVGSSPSSVAVTIKE